MLKPEPVATFPAAWSSGLRFLAIAGFAGTLALLAAFAAIFPEDAAELAVTALIVVLTGLLIWLITPRRYEVRADGLWLKFAFWHWHIPWDSIEVVLPAKSYMAYAYWGLRFATSPGRAVEVRRRDASLFRRPNLIVSPERPEEFIAAARQAMAAEG